MTVWVVTYDAYGERWLEGVFGSAVAVDAFFAEGHDRKDYVVEKVEVR